MSGRWLLFAGFFGLTGIVLGAFGAHALQSAFSASQASAFDTAVRYQLLHAVALLALGLRSGPGMPRLLAAAGVCWIVGIVLFSGSLYAIVLVSQKWLGPVTPIGGLSLMLGWMMVLVSGVRRISGH